MRGGGYFRRCKRRGRGYGHCLHNCFVHKCGNRAMLNSQHALPLRKWTICSCHHSCVPMGLAQHLQVSPSQHAAIQPAGWGLFPLSLSSSGQHASCPGVAEQSWILASSPATGGGKPSSTLGEGRPTQHGHAGFLSGPCKCLRQQWRKQPRRRREVRGTRTPTAMTMAGATLLSRLSGPVGKAADTQSVHEDNKKPQTHFRRPLASPWSETR